MKINTSKKTLVCVIMQTRAHELTFDKFKANVLDELSADLILCIGAYPNDDFSKDPFVLHAKKTYIYEESKDFAVCYDIASKEHHRKLCRDPKGNWRKVLQLPTQLLGGIVSPPGVHQHIGSGSIILFYKWLLLQYLERDNLIDEYDYFIITRSDQYHELKHPKPSDDHILIPSGEDWYGLCDRHTITPKKYVKDLLNLLEWILEEPDDVLNTLTNINTEWNPEQYYAYHLLRKGIINYVRRFNRTFYSVRSIDGPPSWSMGVLDETTNMMVKYPNEKKGVEHTKSLLECTSEYNRNNYGLFGPMIPFLWPSIIIKGFDNRGFKNIIEINNQFCNGVSIDPPGSFPDKIIPFLKNENSCYGPRWSRKWSFELLEFMVRLSIFDLTPPNFSQFMSINLSSLLKKYLNNNYSKSIAIINSICPWVEALALQHKPKNIISIGRMDAPESFHNGIEAINFENFIRKNSKNTDIIINFSLGQDGLGRYGEEIDYDGDIATLIMMRDSIPSNGIIIVILNIAPDNISNVVSNQIRLYGDKEIIDLFIKVSLVIDHHFIDHSRGEVMCVLRKANADFVKFGCNGYDELVKTVSKEAFLLDGLKKCKVYDKDIIDKDFASRNSKFINESMQSVSMALEIIYSKKVIIRTQENT